jgi:hypothetical protein
MKKIFSLLMVGGALLLCWNPAVATEETGHGHGGFHRHHASVFVGNTTNHKGDNALTFGLDYEYRINKIWGLVALADHAGDDIQATVVGVGAMLHSIGDLRLQAAPGLDFHGSHEEFVVRFGALYDFQVGNWTLSPSLYVDVLELESSLIYGLGFGRGF